MSNVRYGQVEVPSSVSDHEAAQFQVCGMTASWHACMPNLNIIYGSNAVPSYRSLTQVACCGSASFCFITIFCFTLHKELALSGVVMYP